MKLTAEQKAIRAEKAKATRAANKARREQRAKESAEMLATMKRLVLSDELDDETRARLILEIREIEHPRSGCSLASIYRSMPPVMMF